MRCKGERVVNAIANTLAVVGHEQQPQPQSDRWSLDTRSGTETGGIDNGESHAQTMASVQEY